MKNKNILVSGIGKSGVSASILLSKLGANVTIQDLNHLKNPKVINLLESNNIKIYTGKNPNDNLIDKMDMMVVSPGLPLDLEFVKYAKSKIPVISEIELGFLNCKAPIIGITGTNGKTTTTSLVGHIFDKYKSVYNTIYIAGNIGLPFSENILDITENDIAILELSSFQLETIKEFRPNISCILNISEDHLNRHKTMENYIIAKERIFKNQTENDYIVLNYDDEVCREMASKTKAKVLYFSLYNNINNINFNNNNNFSAYLDNNIIYVNNNSFMDINQLQVIGNHNIQNVMASILMCLAMDMPEDIIKQGLLDFTAVEHRIEFVDNINNVNYYNDSKGTNVDATIQAMNAMKSPTFIILGGSEKNADFMPIVENLKNNKFKKAILIGEVKNRIAEILDENNLCNYEIKETLLDAVNYCSENAVDGDNVLLSPACASFDMFKNYEERGNLFKKYVLNYKKISI